MKLKIALIALSACMFASCRYEPPAPPNQQETVMVSRKPIDTTWTFARYVVAISKGTPVVKEDRVMRVIKDTFSLTFVDSVAVTKQWRLDTLYFVPLSDTLREKNGRPTLDSVGKPVIVTAYFDLKPRYVLADYNKNF
jgi:hypothetical protein